MSWKIVWSSLWPKCTGWGLGTVCHFIQWGLQAFVCGIKVFSHRPQLKPPCLYLKYLGMRTQFVIKLCFSNSENLFWWALLTKKKILMSINDQSRWKKRKLAAKRMECKNVPLWTLWVLAPTLGHQQVDLKPIDPADTIMTPIIRLSETFWAEKISSSWVVESQF